jgi:hypothetical protein
MKQRKNYYLENNIDQLLAKALTRVEILKVQKEVYDIVAKIERLQLLHPQNSPPSTTE